MRPILTLFVGLSLALIIAIAGCSASKPVAKKPKAKKAKPVPEASNPAPTPVEPVPVPAVPQPAISNVPTNVEPAPQPAKRVAGVPYTNEPLTLPAGTSLAEAEQLFFDHYGPKRLMRLVIHTKDGDPPPRIVDWLNRSLPDEIDGGVTPTVFVSIDDERDLATALVGPIRNERKLLQFFTLIELRGFPNTSQIEAARYDAATRTYTIKTKSEMIPPAADSPEEVALVQKLVEQVRANDVNQGPKALRQLSFLKTPGSAAACVEICLDRLKKYREDISSTHAVKNQKAASEKVILERLAKGEELETAHLLLKLLSEFASEQAIPQMEQSATNLREELRPLVAQAVDKIRARASGERKLEAKIQADDEAPPATPLAADVKLVVKIPDLIDEYAANKEATRSKYEGQVIQVTGRLGISMRKYPDGSHGVSVFSTDPNKGIFCRFSSPSAWSHLAPGNVVTVKGTMKIDFLGPSLADCEILTAEGEPPLSLTIEELGQLGSTQEGVNELVQKYKGKWLKLTGTVAELQNAIIVYQSSGNTGVRSLRFLQSPELRPGMKLIFWARLGPIGVNSIQLENHHLLGEPEAPQE